MQFNKQWKEYLIETRWPGFLLEARIKDVKAKYPVLNDAGWLDWARRQIEYLLTPKGVSKYLMWYAREADRRIGVDDPDELRNDPDVLEMSEAILDHIVLFNQNQHKFEEKDIYKYHDEELKRMLNKLGVTTSAKAQKAAADKKQAEENSEVVYADYGVFAIRPLTEQASCYYGRNPELTNWCISEKEKRNYFVQYTEMEGKAFVMAYFSGLREGHPNHLITLELDHEGDLTMIWDAPNEAQDPDDLYGIIRNHLRGMPQYENISKEELDELEDMIHHDLLAGAKEAVMDNPPPNAFVATERACEAIANEANSDLEHVTVYFDVEDDYYEGDMPMVFYGADVEFSIDISGPVYNNTEKDLEDLDYSTAAALVGEIEDKMSQSGIYGYSELDLHADAGDLYVELKMRPEEAMNVEGFREFCAFDAATADKEIDDIAEVIKAVLAQEGYAKPPGQQLQLPGIDEDIQKYFSHNHLTKQSFYDNVEDMITEEKGRSRQRGIYKFYCMLSYGLTIEADKSRGLDDILADLRALPNVTIVTVVVKNQKISEGKYIAGLSIKFIPSVPGQFRSPEDVKSRILRDIRRLSNVQSIFKVSAGLERLE